MEASRFLHRSLFAGLLVICFSAAASSAPLEITGSDLGGFDDGSIVAGETVSVSFNFTNTWNTSLPFLVVMEFSSEERVTPMDFPPDKFRGFVNGRNRTGCDFYRNLSLNRKSVFCGVKPPSFEGGELTPGDVLMTAKPGRNNFSMDFASNIRLVPADYTLKLDIRSWPGSPSDEGGGSRNVGKAALNRISLPDGSSIGMVPEENGRAWIVPLDNLYVDSPDSTVSFVKAFKVESFDARRGLSMDASGYLNLTYPESLDQGSRPVDIFHYNLSSGSWSNVTDARYPEVNKVYANVSHFSTYAVYSGPGEQQEDDGDGSDPGGSPGFGGGVTPPEDDGQEEEPQGNESSENPQEDDGDGSDPDGDEQQETDSGEDGESGEESGESPGNEGDTGEGSSWLDEWFSWAGDEGLTGYASQSPGAGFLGFLVVVAALLLVLQYSGKADVKGRAEDVFQRVRP